MEEYIAKFWWRNPDTGFVEKREETFFGIKGKYAHKKVANMVCKRIVTGKQIGRAHV